MFWNNYKSIKTSCLLNCVTTQSHERKKKKAKTNSVGQTVSLLLCNCYRIIHTIKINQVKDGPKSMSKFTVCFYVLVVVMGPDVQHYSKIARTN